MTRTRRLRSRYHFELMPVPGRFGTTARWLVRRRGKVVAEIVRRRRCVEPTFDVCRRGIFGLGCRHVCRCHSLAAAFQAAARLWFR